jgi:hypothetical protein
VGTAILLHEAPAPCTDAPVQRFGPGLPWRVFAGGSASTTWTMGPLVRGYKDSCMTSSVAPGVRMLLTRATDLDSIAIYDDSPTALTQHNADRAAGGKLRVPTFLFGGREWGALERFAPQRLDRSQIPGMCHPRRCLLLGTDHHGHPIAREAEKKSRKFTGQVDASMRLGVSGQPTGVQRDAAPGQTFHIGHRRHRKSSSDAPFASADR